MKRAYKSPKTNTHKLATKDTSVDRGKEDDKKFSSYDTKRNETSTPQKVREAVEPEGEQARNKKQKGKL